MDHMLPWKRQNRTRVCATVLSKQWVVLSIESQKLEFIGSSNPSFIIGCIHLQKVHGSAWVESRTSATKYDARKYFKSAESTKNIYRYSQQTQIVIIIWFTCSARKLPSTKSTIWKSLHFSATWSPEYMLQRSLNCISGKTIRATNLAKRDILHTFRRFISFSFVSFSKDKASSIAEMRKTNMSKCHYHV